MQKDLKAIRENIATEYLKRGMSYEDIANELVLFGFTNTTPHTIKLIARNKLIIKLFRQNLIYKDIANIVSSNGFEDTSSRTVQQVVKKYKLQRNYTSKAKNPLPENIVDRNSLVLKFKNQGYSATKINEELVKAGFNTISRQRIYQIVKNIEQACAD